MMYFCHQSVGELVFDPQPKDPKRYKPWWAILMCDRDIVDFYCWLSLKYGIPVLKSRLWGPHISLIKGEIPPEDKLHLWGLDLGPIKYQYTNMIRYDNNRHAWLDVESKQLRDIRQEMGLPQCPGGKDHPMSLHLTLGTWNDN